METKNQFPSSLTGKMMPKRTRAKKKFTTTKTHKYYCLWLIMARANNNVVPTAYEFRDWLLKEYGIKITTASIYHHRKLLIEHGYFYFISRGEPRLRRL